MTRRRPIRRRAAGLAAGCLLLAVAAITAGRARADQFRVQQQETGAYVGYAKLEIQAPAGRLVRYTDYTGFVEINLPPGKYSATVTWGNRTSNIAIAIDNRRGLKTLQVR